MGEMFIENCTNGPFCMTPSHRIIEISILRTNAWEEIGRELKIKLKT
jgi:hypothetical protein